MQIELEICANHLPGATMNHTGNSFRSGGLWSLLDMLQSYLPIYKISLILEQQRQTARVLKTSKISSVESKEFNDLLETVKRDCAAFGLSYTSELADRLLGKPVSETYGDILNHLNNLDDLLGSELSKEAVFRIPPERKNYYDQTDLFGSDASTAFPSCAGDIKNAGSCYALEQPDACVHHLMLVLERGLRALTNKFGVPYQNSGWGKIITKIKEQLDTKPAIPDRKFYVEINAQFGFLKDAYRNHSEHAHDDPYDMEQALSILNHVRSFMQELAKGDLSE
jgi:hypothetical protein